MQNIWNNLKDGLKNYMRANGFSQVILGLSGGLDSAVVAVLAAEALGGENVKAVMMKTKHTSALSLQIAQEIAALNGLDYQEIDIEPLIAAQSAFLTAFFKENPHNIVLENLQARQRGLLLMAFSNQTNALVLACGNKSEILTGYCTLYGDTCGGLAPIAGLYKSEIFALARWRNSLSKVLPEAVISRAPTAELSANQKDEDSLPPYELLDKILKQLVDEGQTPQKIISCGGEAQIVAKVEALYRRSSFKREQLPKALNPF